MSAQDWNVELPDETFWFNTRTGLVEVGRQSLSGDRLGPFTSRSDAEQALQIIADRAAQIRAEEDVED